MSKTDTTQPLSESVPCVPTNVFFTTRQCIELAAAIHYPDCWDMAAYPTLADAIQEIVTNEGCNECKNQ